MAQQLRSFLKKENLLFWAFLFFVLAAQVWFVNRHYAALLHSDAASELILGKLLSGEHALLSTQWYYSTELRILNNQLLYALLFQFLSSWKLVRLVSMVVLELMLVLSCQFLCRQAELGGHSRLLSILLLIPLSADYFLVMNYGLYYIPHIAISFCSIALLLVVLKAKSPRVRTAAACGLGALSFVAGLGGFRQLLILYLPLALASFLLAWPLLNRSNGREISSGLRIDVRGKAFLLSLFSALAGVAGCLVNIFALSGVYSFYQYKNTELNKLDWNQVVVVWNDFLALAGFQPAKAFSLSGFVSLLSLAYFLFVFFVVVYLTKKRKSYSYYEQLLIVFFNCLLIAYLFVALFMQQMYVDRYAIPVLVFHIPLLAIFLKNNRLLEDVWKRVALVGVVASSLTISAFLLLSLRSSADNRGGVLNHLRQEQYTFGYATFWNASVFTELSDGRIEFYNVSDLNNMNNFRWLEKKENEARICNEPVFLLVSTEEENSFASSSSYLGEDRRTYLDDHYAVYRFSSSMDLFTSGFAIENLSYSEGGTFENGVLTIPAGGIQFGPYKALLPGTYRVTLCGGNLTNGAYDVVTGGAADSVPISTVSVEDGTVVYLFTIDGTMNDVELRCRNAGTEPIVITGFQLTPQAA